MTLRPRAVLVQRRSEYDEVLVRHGTRQQAAFFLEGRGRSIDELADRHHRQQEAWDVVSAAVPADWRRATVERADLDRFDLAEGDVVVVVGQDGLVANVAKYLRGQPVIGINPDPGRNPGILVPHRPHGDEVARLLVAAADGRCRLQHRTMVVARTDDGQELHALNEVYVGHRSHQSARYRIVLADGSAERQSSSGLLAGTGTGATGWLRSVWQERNSAIELPAPTDPGLCWFVREAWPSLATGTSLTQGVLAAGDLLSLQAESDGLVCFGDGIEADALHLSWGQTLTVTTASRTLDLVVAGVAGPTTPPHRSVP